MAKRVSFDHILMETQPLLTFPPDFARQLQEHEEQRRRNTFYASQSGGMYFPCMMHGGMVNYGMMHAHHQEQQQQAFYDVDDLSLIPFDSVEF